MTFCEISAILNDHIWGHFLSLAQSKPRLCSANHRVRYFNNLACDWLSIVWAYYKQETENGLRSKYWSDMESSDSIEILMKTYMSNFTISTVSADGQALLGAKTSAGIVLTIYTRLAHKNVSYRLTNLSLVKLVLLREILFVSNVLVVNGVPWKNVPGNADDKRLYI